MEGMNKPNKIGHGLPPLYPYTKGKAIAYSLPISMVSSCAPPLAPSTFQIWNRPYSRNYGASSSTTDSVASSSKAPKSLHPLTSNTGIINREITLSPSLCDQALADVKFRMGRVDPNMDQKKLRRIISNRYSAQKSRMKRQQYVIGLQRRTKALEAQIAVLRPQFSVEKDQNQSLQIENKSLNQRMAECTDDTVTKDAEIGKNEEETIRLRQFNMQEQWMPVWENGLEGLMNPSSNQSSWLDEMLYPSAIQANYGEMTEEINRLNNQIMMNQPAMEYGNGGIGTNIDYQLLNNQPGLMLGMVSEEMNRLNNQFMMNQPAMEYGNGGAETNIDNQLLNNQPGQLFGMLLDEMTVLNNQIMTNQPAAMEYGNGGAETNIGQQLLNNQRGQMLGMLIDEKNGLNDQIMMNQPATMEYGNGIAETNGHLLTNNQPGQLLGMLPDWNQLGTVQLPNPNSHMINPNMGPMVVQMPNPNSNMINPNIGEMMVQMPNPNSSMINRNMGPVFQMPNSNVINPNPGGTVQMPNPNFNMINSKLEDIEKFLNLDLDDANFFALLNDI
ncbi:hypothetical protein ACOSQ2_025436 [Xanthoceras sorbifolium]